MADDIDALGDLGDVDPRRRADEVALDDHVATSARPAHRTIASRLWPALRSLGFTSGSALAVGEDAGTLLGLPHTDGHTFTSLSATVTAAHEPGRALAVHEVVPRPGDRFDLVIGLLPYNDVRLQHPQNVVTRRAGQARLAITLAALTHPGGTTVLLASHDLLDNRYPGPRQHLHQLCDLTGAVRLPAGIHRQLPGLDLTTDLLLLHRRREDEPSQSADFEQTVSVTVDGHPTAVNTYFDNHPDHILGTVATDPLAWGPAAITVMARPERLDANLRTALGQITDDPPGSASAGPATTDGAAERTQNRVTEADHRHTGRRQRPEPPHPIRRVPRHRGGTGLEH